MPRAAVTGAFSYTGRYLTRLLLDSGHSVVNLSSRSVPISSATVNFSAKDLERIETRPLNFNEGVELGRSLQGCDVLYCTYFIRFAMGGDSHAKAAARLAGLFQLAKEASVRKVVFSSHTHASEDSAFPYIANKARAAASLRSCGIDYGIVRPCGIFGDTAHESILMNNAAWVLRRTPLFLLAGTGEHRFQPVHVRDMASLMLELGTSSAAAEERDACGPDAPTALELFSAIGAAVGSRAFVKAPGLPSKAVTLMTQPINWCTGDILLDTDDIDLLCSGLTVADNPSDAAIAGRRSLLEWLQEAGPELGQEYVSSVKRYYKH